MSSSRGPEDCLDESTVFALCTGSLAADARGGALRHVAGCDACRELVAETARSLGGEAAHAASAAESSAPNSVGALAPGTSIGRYRIAERRGAGAMGVVYAAEDRVLGRRVALKFLRGFGAGDEAEERLAREARAMAKLSHPNVVGVYDLGEHAGRLFVAMELVEGPTLAAWLAEGAPDPSRILDRFLAAGRGLVAAHAAGVVHRDFKPSNVLVASDGRVRVTDFGLARSFESETGPVEVDPRDNTMWATRAGTLLGTPGYMAPEQLRGGVATERSDQFSFAVSLYEALYGERPFHGDTVEALSAAIEEGRIRDAPSNASVPEPVALALRRALSARPEDRFASMSELVSELESTSSDVRRDVVSSSSSGR